MGGGRGARRAGIRNELEFDQPGHSVPEAQPVLQREAPPARMAVDHRPGGRIRRTKPPRSPRACRATSAQSRQVLVLQEGTSSPHVGVQAVANTCLHRSRSVGEHGRQAQTRTATAVRAIMQSCSRAAMQPCSHAAMQPCSHAVMQSCSLAFMHSCTHALMHSCSQTAIFQLASKYRVRTCASIPKDRLSGP